jgi:cyclopropane fatty-acyl-phospholipid synthase-like methyltransferase
MKNGMGSNPLWIAEWLASAMTLEPGMRVLDLGCGKAVSSIFLAREFGVQVWATDLWIGASANRLRIHDAGLDDRVFPIHADARALPYAGEFFDAMLSHDSFPYYGTDDLYLNYLAHFVKPGGQIGIAGAGLIRELEDGVPEHLKDFWTEDMWCLHGAEWWRQHWQRTGIVDVELAETMAEGWQFWLDWQRTAWPENRSEIETIEADRGRNLGYVRMVARRRGDARLNDYCWPDTMKSFPMDYDPRPLLRS